MIPRGFYNGGNCDRGGRRHGGIIVVVVVVVVSIIVVIMFPRIIIGRGGSRRGGCGSGQNGSQYQFFQQKVVSGGRQEQLGEGICDILIATIVVVESQVRIIKEPWIEVEFLEVAMCLQKW